MSEISMHTIVISNTRDNLLEAAIWLRQKEPLPLALLSLQAAINVTLGREIIEDLVDSPAAEPEWEWTPEENVIEFDEPDDGVVWGDSRDYPDWTPRPPTKEEADAMVDVFATEAGYDDVAPLISERVTPTDTNSSSGGMGRWIKPDGDLSPDGRYYLTGTGQKLDRIHSPDQCEGRPCVIHNPSDHNMRGFRTNWRHGGMYDIKPPHMERICEHGVGHPDPDDADYWRMRGENIEVHGCDGCCGIS